MKPVMLRGREGTLVGTTQESDKDGGIGRLSQNNPRKALQNVTAALHDKAKKSPDFRLLCAVRQGDRKDVLTFAYECCKANGGAAGVDDQTFEDPAPAS